MQDAFKVSKRLTLDLGLRWDHFGPEQLQRRPDLQLGSGDGQRHCPAERAEYHQPALSDEHHQGGRGTTRRNRPRCTTSIRGWASRGGRSARRPCSAAATESSRRRWAGSRGFSPTDRSSSRRASPTRSRTGRPLFAFPNPFPSGRGTVASQSITGYPTDTSNGRIHQFNFSVERQIKDVGVRLSYVGARDRGLNYTMNINKPVRPA